MCIIYFVLTWFMLGNTFCEGNLTKEPFDYCSHPDCSLQNQHTMCVAREKQSARLYASGMTTWMRYQLLLLHNRQRDNIALGLEPGQPPAANMRKMYWDYELEHMAQLWARQCQKRHDECRNTIRFNVLQNMDVRPVVARVTEAQLLADAVGAWFSGSRVLPQEYVWSFRLSNCSAPGGCNSHWYSAAAWASTWRLGCSQALCTVKRRSCALFRRRREGAPGSGPQAPQTPDEDDFNNVTRTTAYKENILRRTKYMTTEQNRRLEDFAATVKSNAKESPLHRGALDMAVLKKQRKDPNIMAYTFCNYGPAGNIDGFPIYESGPTCSNCPQGTRCGDRTHRALCSLLGDPDHGAD